VDEMVVVDSWGKSGRESVRSAGRTLPEVLLELVATD
jgi:hypothetical protein